MADTNASLVIIGRRVSIGLMLLVVCIVTYAAITKCIDLDKQKATMKITDHPSYESLRAYKKANEIELMKKFAAHAVGIRWLVDGNLSGADSQGNANRPDKKIAIAVYVSSANGGTNRVPDSIEVQNINGNGVIVIPVLTIVSPQPSFE